jgi:CBS domain-containing protein
MKIQNLMTPNVESCTPQTSLTAAAMVMWRQDCGIVPVVDTNRLVVGVLTDRDICMAVATRHRRPEDIDVEDVMSRRVVSVRREDDTATALERMRTARVRRLPVVDRDGRLEGVVSLNDIVLHTDPGSKHGSELSVADVLETLRVICTHPVPTRTEPHKHEEQVAHVR